MISPKDLNDICARLLPVVDAALEAKLNPNDFMAYYANLLKEIDKRLEEDERSKT